MEQGASVNPVQTFISALLIISSVFLGFQVDRWWDEKRARDTEQTYLQRLRGDVETDLEQLGRRITYFEGVKDFGTKGLAYLDGNENDTDRELELLVAFYLASHAWDFTPASTTFDELKSAGTLPLIRDLELRSILAMYYQSLNNASYVWRAPNYYRRSIRSLIPASMQRSLWNACHELAEEGSRQSFVADCAPGIPAPQITPVLARVKASRAVHENLNFLVANTDVSLDLFRAHHQKTSELLERLSQSIKH
jgi:hypothetical protein